VKELYTDLRFLVEKEVYFKNFWEDLSFIRNRALCLPEIFVLEKVVLEKQDLEIYRFCWYEESITH